VFIYAGLVELGLGEVFYGAISTVQVIVVPPAESGEAEVRQGEVRPVEVRFAEVRPAEGRIPEVRPAEGRCREVRLG